MDHPDFYKHLSSYDVMAYDVYFKEFFEEGGEGTVVNSYEEVMKLSPNNGRLPRDTKMITLGKEITPVDATKIYQLDKEGKYWVSNRRQIEALVRRNESEAFQEARKHRRVHNDLVKERKKAEKKLKATRTILKVLGRKHCLAFHYNKRLPALQNSVAELEVRRQAAREAWRNVWEERSLDVPRCFWDSRRWFP